jgi:EmrB/QacA subfamily drug resistance transporter
MTHREVLVIMGGLMMALLLAALDQTIVASAMRVVADDLNGLSMQAWATTAYLITAAVTTPLYGKLSDLYGRKPLLLLAMTVFILGSALSAMSHSMYELAAFRAIQGLGAGGLFSLVLATIGDIVSPRERARYQGYFLAVFGTSSVVGPVVGGFFAGSSEIFGVTGWRWVFLINVPIGLAAMAVVSRVLRLPHIRRQHRIDWQGAAALGVGLVPLLIVAEQGRGWGWTSGRTLALIGIGLLGLLMFVLAERRIGDDALIPLKHFRNPTFSVANGAGLVIGMSMFGAFACVPLYLQIVKGASPTESGLMMLPMMLGVITGSAASGQAISRTGRYKLYPIIGSALLVIGLLLFSQVGADTPLWQTGISMLVFGLGLGGNLQALTLAVQAALPPSEMGVATSSATFSRQMGGTLGTAVFLSILFSTVYDKIGNAAHTIMPTTQFQAAVHDPVVMANPANQFALTALQQGGMGGISIDDSSFINQIDSRLAKPFMVGFADSMDLVFLVASAVTVLALALVVFLKEVPLSSQSGIVARQQAAAAAPGE